MSSTNRGHQRIELDHYATPTYAVHRLLDALSLFPIAHWLEPAAGNGAIVRAVHTWNATQNRPSPVWTAMEIRDDAEGDLRASPKMHKVLIGDFLQMSPASLVDTERLSRLEGSKPYPVVLTNPPFALAMEFIRACLPLAEHTIMLLRLNFLGSEERSDFIRETTPDLYVLPDRPEFAMSISCGGRIERQADDEIIDHGSCGHKSTLPFTVARPKACPGCGGRVKITTSDSVSYAWFHWHDRAEGKYTMLASTPVAERKKDQFR